MKSGRVEALVCTDVGARGIDIDDCDLVLNYDMAPLPATHIHRLVQKIIKHRYSLGKRSLTVPT